MIPAILYRRIRRRCDLQDGEFLEDDEIGELAEESYLALWDFMIATLGEEAPWELSSVNTVANQAYVDIPLTAGCYRLLRLDTDLGGDQYVPIDRGQLISDPWRVAAQQWTHASDVRYYARRGVRATAAARVAAAGPDAYATWRVYFSPTPTAVHAVRMFYVPPPIITLSDDDPAQVYTAFPDEYPEFVVADVAMKIATRQEADLAPHIAAMAAAKELIQLATPQQVMPRRIMDQRRHQAEMHHDDYGTFMRR